MTKETVLHRRHDEEEVVADLGTSKIVSKLHALTPFGKFRVEKKE